MSNVKKEKIRKVFIEDLPRKDGVGALKGQLVIDWIRSAELKCRVRFIYDDIEGYVEIVGYKKGGYLYIKYLNNEPFKIFIGNFQICQLGGLLKNRTKEFKVEIGTIFKDDKRDLVIIDREIREIIYENNNKINYKYYKYKCNKCGFNEKWIVESALITLKEGCSCCNSKTIVHGINSVYDTAPWMVKFFVNPEDAKKYTYQSNKPVKVKCPDCGKVKEFGLNDLYRRKSIRCICSDGFSYPEKFMNMVLNQLNIEFVTQLTKNIFKWCKNYRYDFYFELKGEKYIIETHGEQHYEKSFYTIAKGKSLNEEIENDRVKKELALTNEIKEENYIVIDCRESELEWIKKNVLKSRLVKLFDLSNVNWLKCEEFALSNRVKEACEIKKKNPDMTTGEIGKIMSLDRHTVYKYLKKGSKIWDWVNYDSSEELYKRSSKAGRLRSKQVEVFKDELSLGVFKSGTELDRVSEELFGVKLDFRSISAVCLGKIPHHKGFTFKYI